MVKPVITIMGPIGTGKTLQARAVARELGWETFSTGDLIRQGANAAAKEAHDHGRLAPTEFVQELVLGKVKSIPEDKGVILDGSPRMLAEAERYEREFPGIHRELRAVILLKVDRSEIDRRLALRGRSDDTPEGISTRFQHFNEDIMPTIESYRQKGLVYEVDGSGDPAEVTARIIEVLHDQNIA